MSIYIPGWALLVILILGGVTMYAVTIIPVIVASPDDMPIMAKFNLCVWTALGIITMARTLWEATP